MHMPGNDMSWILTIRFVALLLVCASSLSGQQSNGSADQHLSRLNALQLQSQLQFEQKWLLMQNNGHVSHAQLSVVI